MLYMSINLCLSNSLKLQHLLILYFCIIQLTLTLSVLTLKICRVPSTADSANVQYLERYADLHLATLISVLCLFSAQCLNTESILKGSCVIYCL